MRHLSTFRKLRWRAPNRTRGLMLGSLLATGLSRRTCGKNGFSEKRIFVKRSKLVKKSPRCRLDLSLPVELHVASVYKAFLCHPLCTWMLVRSTSLIPRLPNETACSSGQGLANEAGQFVMLRGQPYGRDALVLCLHKRNFRRYPVLIPFQLKTVPSLCHFYL